MRQEPQLTKEAGSTGIGWRNSTDTGCAGCRLKENVFFHNRPELMYITMVENTHLLLLWFSHLLTTNTEKLLCSARKNEKWTPHNQYAQFR